MVPLLVPLVPFVCSLIYIFFIYKEKEEEEKGELVGEL